MSFLDLRFAADLLKNGFTRDDIMNIIRQEQPAPAADPAPETPAPAPQVTPAADPAPQDPPSTPVPAQEQDKPVPINPHKAPVNPQTPPAETWAELLAKSF